MAVRQRKPLGEGNTYADEVMRAWDRQEASNEAVFAYCYAGGEIAFGAEVPPGALAIAKGREDALRDLMSATARHAYDGETLLVPGVPEAGNQSEGINALIRWSDWLRKRQIDGVQILSGRT